MSVKRLNLLVLAGFVFFAAVTALPQPANASWLEFFFPHLKQKGPDPSETLKAPFADPDAVVETKTDQGTLNENSTPLNMRHRSNVVIGEWVEKTISEILTYEASDYNQKYKEKSALFDTTGLKEYVQFLNDQNIVTSLKSGQYNVRGFVQDAPAVINEGELYGRYRWLYQIKVMISYVKADMKSYKDASADDELSREFIVNVHVGRVKGVKNEHGLLIEGFTGKVRKPGE